ncbi:MAG: bacteriophage Gp15 family protein [Oscillospiraceae bacterium]|nr:bacteriophage Gp15 family protein [Oscillospiraceae bacterium]
MMKVTALLRDSGISEEARVSAGVRGFSSPLSHTRSKHLSNTDKIALLNKIFELLVPSANSEAKQKTKLIFSLEKDGALIYSAFLQTYGIDLQKDKIDWREFNVLLSCIPENTALFCVMKSRLAEPFENIDDGLETLFEKLIK